MDAITADRPVQGRVELLSLPPPLLNPS